MVKLYSFTRGSLELPFSELFLSDASLRNQYKFTAFNIFTSYIFIIYCKILIIAVISNETTNELTMYPKLCRIFTMFSRQYLASLCQV